MREDLQKKQAYLEFINDQLESELEELEELLKAIGFPKGIASLKEAAQDILEEKAEEEEEI